MIRCFSQSMVTKDSLIHLSSINNSKKLKNPNPQWPDLNSTIRKIMVSPTNFKCVIMMSLFGYENAIFLPKIDHWSSCGIRNSPYANPVTYRHEQKLPNHVWYTQKVHLWSRDLRPNYRNLRNWDPKPLTQKD